MRVRAPRHRVDTVPSERHASGWSSTASLASFNERVDLVVDGERLKRPFTPWSLDVRA